MEEIAKGFSVEEAHHHFAVMSNGQVWELLQKTDRTSADDDRMILAVHASAYHWRIVGNGLNQQRAEWLITNVFNTLGWAGPARRHASRCLELANEFADLMHDFDHAYAFEGIARASALAGDFDQARHYHSLAATAGQAIQDAEDRQVFEGDFEGGNWHGLR